MRRAAIVAPLRTAVGGYGKALRTVPVEDLAATVVKAVVQRSGIDPERIEDVSFAQSYASSEVPCIGRWIALHAGLPEHVAGIQIDRRCGAGLQAIVTAAMTMQTGAADVMPGQIVNMVVVGGSDEGWSFANEFETECPARRLLICAGDKAAEIVNGEIITAVCPAGNSVFILCQRRAIAPVKIGGANGIHRIESWNNVGARVSHRGQPCRNSQDESFHVMKNITFRQLNRKKSIAIFWSGASGLCRRQTRRLLNATCVG